GSERALKMTEELMRFKMNTEYKASALLAKEKGSFPDYDEAKYLEGEFVKKLDKQTINLIKKHGIRNSHLSSIQPTGNSSVLANLVSSSAEPSFSAKGYYRTFIVDHPPEGLLIPYGVDWQ